MNYNSLIPDPWIDDLSVVETPKSKRISSYASCSEEQLANTLRIHLERNGIDVQQELQCGVSSAIRADLVTNNAVIELKKTLHRSALYQALGQAQIYAKLLGKQHVWVVGCLPSNLTDQEQALRIASDFQDSGINVVFVDDDNVWLETIVIGLLNASTIAPQNYVIDVDQLSSQISDRVLQQISQIIPKPPSAPMPQASKPSKYKYLMDELLQEAVSMTEASKKQPGIVDELKILWNLGVLQLIGLGVFSCAVGMLGAVWFNQNRFEAKMLDQSVNNALWECRNSAQQACLDSLDRLEHEFNN